MRNLKEQLRIFTEGGMSLEGFTLKLPPILFKAVCKDCKARGADGELPLLAVLDLPCDCWDDWYGDVHLGGIDEARNLNHALEAYASFVEAFNKPFDGSVEAISTREQEVALVFAAFSAFPQGSRRQADGTWGRNEEFQEIMKFWRAELGCQLEAAYEELWNLARSLPREVIVRYYAGKIYLEEECKVTMEPYDGLHAPKPKKTLSPVEEDRLRTIHAWKEALIQEELQNPELYLVAYWGDEVDLLDRILCGLSGPHDVLLVAPRVAVIEHCVFSLEDLDRCSNRIVRLDGPLSPEQGETVAALYSGDQTVPLGQMKALYQAALNL